MIHIINLADTITSLTHLRLLDISVPLTYLLTYLRLHVSCGIYSKF